MPITFRASFEVTGDAQTRVAGTFDFPAADPSQVRRGIQALGQAAGEDLSSATDAELVQWFTQHAIRQALRQAKRILDTDARAGVTDTFPDP